MHSFSVSHLIHDIFQTIWLLLATTRNCENDDKQRRWWYVGIILILGTIKIGRSKRDFGCIRYPLS